MTRTILFAVAVVCLTIISQTVALGPVYDKKQSCGWCRAGNCKILKGAKAPSILDLQKDTDGTHKHYGSGAREVTVTQGTPSDSSDKTRLTIDAAFTAWADTNKCFVLGLTDKTATEHYAILNFSNQEQQFCERVIELDFATLKDIRVWQLDDYSVCPKL